MFPTTSSVVDETRFAGHRHPITPDLEGVQNSMPPGFQVPRATHTLPRLQFTFQPPMPSDASAAAPIVRWLSSWSSTPNKSPTHSRSRSESPSSYSEPPSPCLTSLNEALSSTIPHLPAKPPSALLPSSFYASRNLSRPPPFLDNLTRSTLPTASLSRAMPLSPLIPIQDTNTQVPDTTAVIFANSRSSIDSLRTVWDRGIHTSAPTEANGTPALSWWWSQGANKENVDTLLNEDDRADTAQEEHDQIRQKYRAPKNPIVFCHGLLGFDSVSIGPAIAPMQVTHWRGIKEVLEANGVEVLITRVPATSSVEDRAKVLEQRISDVYPGRSVHLIGHSMGGLDCRFLTSQLPLRTFKVLSVTTIATPHRGSTFADHFLSTIGPARLPSILSLLDLLPNGGGDGKAFECLTVESMRAFNEEVKDVDGVKYFSWGATYDPGLIDTWKWPHSVILEKEGPNDGLVSVESSRWGTYLGTLQDVNHLDLVGWINTARYKWAEMFGKEIKFRPATFYLGVADLLAGEVEGQPKERDDGGDEGEEGKCSVSSSSKPSGNFEMLGGSDSSELAEAVRKAPQAESVSTATDAASSPESRLLSQADKLAHQDSSDKH